LTYRCDPQLHRVTVSDEFDRVILAFGGRSVGSFQTPLDLAFVRPEFVGESLPASGPDAVWVAVADYGNRRIQILELDGVPVGVIDTAEVLNGPPCGLSWRSPVLEVVGIEGVRSSVHLMSALLCSEGGAHLSRPPREWVRSRTWVN
jgi:hypothetical protein